MRKGLDFILRELKTEDKIILLSIKPRFSELILRGEKTIELRRTFPKLYSKYVLVYESQPTKKIIALLKINKIHIKRIKEIRVFSEKAKVTKTFINEYFKGKDKGIAIEIERVFELEEKIPLEKLGLSPPQNFRYIEKEKISCLM